MVLKIIKFWITLTFVVTLVCGTILLSVQQNYRQSANDPQIQMAEDAAANIGTNTFYTSFDVNKKIEISKSLAPFIIIFDQSGNVISTNAVLNGEKPTLPTGVFDYVRGNGEDRLTWQPIEGTRIAAVVTSYTSAKTSGFVLAGRNLREVENRENMLNMQIALGWAITVFGSFVVIFFLEFITPKGLQASLITPKKKRN